MTDRQKQFAMEYLKTLNATQSAKVAGYSAKTAYSKGHSLLKVPEIKKYVEEKLEAIENDSIAKTEEIMEYLTSVLRGSSDEEVIVVEGQGDGISSATTHKKQVSAKDRLKAAELLGKRYGLYSEGVTVSMVTPVVISGDDELD